MHRRTPSVGQKLGFAATVGRDELMTWCDDNDVDYLFGLSRNARLTERVGRQLRRSRSRCVSTGKASRRFCDFRYRTRGTWSRARRVVAKAEWLPGLRSARFVVTCLSRKRAGARVLYEKLYCARGEQKAFRRNRRLPPNSTARAGRTGIASRRGLRGRQLYCARGENRIKEQQLVRRPDVDRDPVRQPGAPLLCGFRQHFGGGGPETRPRRHRGRQGTGRNDSGEVPQGRRLHLRAQGSALVFFDLRRNCSPGFWRTCGRLRRRRRSAVRGSGSPPPPPSKAGSPTTGLVCSRSLPRGVAAVRDHERSLSFRKGHLIRPPGRGSGPAVVPKTASATRSRPLDLVRYPG